MGKRPDRMTKAKQRAKGKLQEEIETRGHEVIFHSKFHSELNAIEPY